MRRRADRGQASLELVALLPVLFFGGLLALQAGVAAWTVSSTAEAARQAARAYGLQPPRDPRAVAEASLPGGLRVQSLTVGGPGHRVRLTVRIPSLVAFDVGSVTREVVMP